MPRLNSHSKLAIAGIGALAVLAAGGLFGHAALASASSSGDTLAGKIAAAFHLDQTAVQKVIDQDRQDHQANRQQELKDRLDQAVKDGGLTSDQETLIINKLQELDTQRKNDASRPTKAQMDQRRTDLEAWAKAAGIDMKWLRPMGGHGPGHMPQS